jgi:hypothetical protein
MGRSRNQNLLAGNRGLGGNKHSVRAGQGKTIQLAAARDQSAADVGET